MEYKRITERIKNASGASDKYGGELVQYKYGKDKTLAECLVDILGRLAELEDKIESGLLAELPCKVGDPAYYVVVKGVYSTLVSTNVEEIHIVGRNEYIIHLQGTIRKIYLDNSGRNDIAFLCKEDAEAKLKELKNK